MTPERRRARSDGIAALEVALSLPAVLLVTLFLLHAWVWARDALLVQEAARAAGRAAATTAGPAGAQAVVAELLPGRGAGTEVVGARRVGGLLEVTVSLPTRSLLGDVVTATTVVAVEPVP